MPVIAVSGDQTRAFITPDGEGGLFVVWEDERSGTGWDVYAQKIGVDGNPQWAPDGVAVVAEADNQQSPVVVPDGAGGAFILWEDKRDGAYFDIYGQRIDSAGNLSWGTGGVLVCGATASQYRPAAVSDGAGGLIVSWHDWRSTSDPDIYAQRLGSDGQPLWTVDGVPVIVSPGRQQYPAIVGDGAGGALIVWEDQRDQGEYDVYAQRLDPTGQIVWAAEGIAVTDAVKDQMFPSIAADGAGGAVVAWEDWRGGDKSNLFAQRIDTSGNRLWGGNGASVCGAGDDQYEPIVERSETNHYIIVWEDWRTTTDGDVYAQRFDDSGAASWVPDGVAIATGASRQQYPKLRGDGEGGAVVAWQDRPGSSDSDVRSQWIDVTGLALCPEAGLPLTDAAGDQKFPLMVSDGEGGAIVVWEDQRGADQDLYSQRFFRDFDQEGLTDCFEAQLGTDPGAGDSDQDGLTDYEEIAYDGDDSGYDPQADTDPNNPDTDSDLTSDGLDCRPLDDTVWREPVEVSDVSLVEDALLRIDWQDQEASTGSATVYDILRGPLSDLRQSGGFFAASCLAWDLPAPPWEGTVEDPPGGDGIYFLLRAENVCDSGTYGSPSRDEAVSSPCP